ncbi:MAG TPA: protein tyrosine phosphatase family protein [Vicinamibacteria bacterium]|nr:protein tyrosine phosphatase family protein [Vicinamibacteria bacterium]
MRRIILALALLCFVAPLGLGQDKLEDIRAYLRISDQLATSGQIEYQQIPAIKDAGFDVVVNLAPARKERNGEEGFLVTEQGMTYIQIPVDWENPSLRDLDLFFDVMNANQDRKVYVHCFANMRVSAFVYLYRTLELGLPKDQAHADLAKIWDPASEPQWARFIEQAEARK